jgi:hypothetical protein
MNREEFSDSRLQAIANAKLVLKQAGYFVDNLWSIHDITQGSEEERMKVLDKVLTSEYIQGQIIELIESEIK